MKIGIIGAGRIGKVHLESVSRYVKGAEVVAMADPFLNAETEEFIKGFGVKKVSRDYKEILADKEIDAVLICSSTDTHAPISLEAIAAGKHVFCEKPVDHDIQNILKVKRRSKGARSNIRWDSTAVSTITSPPSERRWKRGR